MPPKWWRLPSLLHLKLSLSILIFIIGLSWFRECTQGGGLPSIIWLDFQNIMFIMLAHWRAEWWSSHTVCLLHLAVAVGSNSKVEMSNLCGSWRRARSAHIRHACFPLKWVSLLPSIGRVILEDWGGESWRRSLSSMGALSCEGIDPVHGRELLFVEMLIEAGLVEASTLS